MTLVNSESAQQTGRNGTAALASDIERSASFDLSDLTSVRNLLRSGSVVDWHRLYFTDRSQVDRYLRINEFDPANPEDIARLEALREQAVEYLERYLGFRVSEDVAARVPARDLLLVASQKGKRRTHACVVLKVMHVLHHLAGGELATRLAVSADQIFQHVEDKVLRTVEEMKSAGFQIVEFEWSRKEEDSLITKLLAKRDNLAAHVYDKLRFRMITRTEEEIVLVLRELLHRLVPFNYVIPGESQNDIVDLQAFIERDPYLRAHLPDLLDLSNLTPDKRTPLVNEFSGPSYRVVNFVADLPVRMDKHLGLSSEDPLFADTGSVVFVLTEFQIVDVRTAQANEQGENSHERYKERQATRVRGRLMHGMQDDENGGPVLDLTGRQDGDLGHD
ncbi:MAG TPA: TIGR04552 family protein [Polyangia bacterium]